MLRNSVIAVNRSPQTREADKKESRQQEVTRDFWKTKKTIKKHVIADLSLKILVKSRIS